MTRLTARVAVPLLTAVALTASGCASGGTASPGTPSAGASSPSASAAPGVKGTEVVISVKGGAVSPPTHRVKVSKGSRVRLLITSDTADEVHVHGYDIEQKLPAGAQTTVAFVADEVGLFEVETHESGLQLVQLEVR